jgi:predicted TIM-barrel fold metal-dependent hydrolase
MSKGRSPSVLSKAFENRCHEEMRGAVIIDCHTHVFPDEVRRDRDKYAQRDSAFGEIYGDDRAKMVGVDELIRSMDEAGVDKAVACGFPWSDNELCAAGNDYIVQGMRRFPERIIGFGSVQPSTRNKAVFEAERCISLGMKGIGELASYAEGLSTYDIDSMKPICEFLIREDLPLMLHANETVGHHYPGKCSTSLKSIYEFISAFPGLRIILAHWGGGFFLYELMPEVAKVAERTWYDTAASPFLYHRKIYSVAVTIVGVHKILFGSDYPLMRQERYIQEMGEAGLGEEERRNILGRNMKELLKL